MLFLKSTKFFYPSFSQEMKSPPRVFKREAADRRNHGVQTSAGSASFFSFFPFFTFSPIFPQK